jgi:hypothetical protein
LLQVRESAQPTLVATSRLKLAMHARGDVGTEL